MPSNTKATGSKNQPEATTLKNTVKPTVAKNVGPAITPAHVMNRTETTNLGKLTGNMPPDPQTAGQAPLTAKASHQDTVDDANSSTGINKKKQKRRQKEAARKAAEQPPIMTSERTQEIPNGADGAYQNIVKEMASAHTQGQANGYGDGASDYDDPEHYEPDDGEEYYTDDINRPHQNSYDSIQINGHGPHNYAPLEPTGGKAKKKKKSKSGTTSQDVQPAAKSMPFSSTQGLQPPPPPPPPSGNHRSTHHNSKDRIWNTSTAQERERIKEFWLSLGEEDRRSLVKVEKEAVLKKMKEQQKHSCSCTVCGRKRTAIEEELEVLYDAYYEELEQYANTDGGRQGTNADGTPMLASSRMYPHPMTRVPPNRHSQNLSSRSSRGRIHEVGDDDEAGEDADYSEDEDEDELSDDELVEEPTREAVDFFNFGKNLTVKGGILTVADDLLKNDGKKFIEMMEQLAERRMQREEEAQFAAAGMGHNHGPPLDDDGYDDDDDEDYDSQDDEEYDEEDEMESMTEIQRMDEGRRMFQIFAARMFEQRVLTAYREKVALERQQKLIEELDDESRVDAQREAKKAKEAQKKKDKKRQQKLAKDEERAKREAEKAAEEAAAKALEERKAEEIRLKKEEQRKKKEAEKKAQEEEKQRKEAEKQRRLQEQKEQQAEQERKQREQKEREKRQREEAKKKVREEREAKEAEARERKERDAAERRQREAKAKTEHQAKEQSRPQDSTIKQPVQSIAKRPSPVNGPSTTISIPPGLHPPTTTSTHASPHLQIATPVIPKAPTPVRPRQSSLQESRNTSPKASQAASSSTTSPSVSSAQQQGTTVQGKSVTHPSLVQQVQPTPRYSPVGASPGQVTQPPGFPSLPSMPANGFPSPVGPPMSPTIQQGNPAIFSAQLPIGSGQYRNFAPSNNMPFASGINGSRQMPQAIARMVDSQPSPASAGGFVGGSANDVSRYGMSRDNIPSQSHSRNTSASFDRSSFEQTQPIARPAPIQRPSSVAPHQQAQDGVRANVDVDDLSNHLGSSALLDDTDVPLNSQSNGSRQGSMAPGGPRAARQGFGHNPGFPDPIGSTRMDNFPRGMQSGNGGNWPVQQSPFGVLPMSGAPSWSNPPGFGRSNTNTGFGPASGPFLGNASRAVTIRRLVSSACVKLTSEKSRSPMSQTAGWHRAEDVHREVLQINPQVHMQEMLEICDTEGNEHNGNGTFSTTQDHTGGLFIKFEPGRNASISGSRAPGEIGSPVIGGAMPTIGGQRPFQQSGGF